MYIWDSDREEEGYSDAEVSSIIIRAKYFVRGGGGVETGLLFHC